MCRTASYIAFASATPPISGAPRIGASSTRFLLNPAAVNEPPLFSHERAVGQDRAGAKRQERRRQRQQGQQREHGPITANPAAGGANDFSGAPWNAIW